MKPECYISGPVTGTTDYIERFKKAEAIVREYKWEPINPVAVNALLPSDTSWIEYMKMSLEMLTRKNCAAILMLKGWENSRGARIEREIAIGLGYTILYEEHNGWIYSVLKEHMRNKGEVTDASQESDNLDR